MELETSTIELMVSSGRTASLVVSHSSPSSLFSLSSAKSKLSMRSLSIGGTQMERLLSEVAGTAEMEDWFIVSTDRSAIMVIWSYTA